jgi:hypothetical protein
MKIAALIFGILGGLAGLTLAAYGDVAVALLSLGGMRPSDQALLKLILWGIPVCILLGSGLAPTKPGAGGTLMLMGAGAWFLIGAYFGHGINFITGSTVILGGIGGVLALLAPDHSAPREVENRRTYRDYAAPVLVPEVSAPRLTTPNQLQAPGVPTDQLTQLAELRSKGVLTDAEFQELKARLLRTNDATARPTRSALEELARLKDKNERGEITDTDYERAVAAIQRARG